jgi:acyl-CoA synthetase (AMP-forming)/AMP-acid ligase II
LSHSNLINNAYLTGHRLGLASDPANTIACIPVPLFHIFGMVYGNVMMSQMGITIVLPSHKYRVQSVIDAINRRQCSHIMMVPAMTVDILRHVQKTNTEIPSLRSKLFKIPSQSI